MVETRNNRDIDFGKELEGRRVALLLFDVDGVLTDERANVDLALLYKIAEFANRGVKVGFVTGRSLAWMEANVLNSLEKMVAPRMRKNIHLEAEKGGALASYNPDGQRSTGIEVIKSVPAKVMEKVRNLASRYSTYVTFDTQKETMATIEGKHEGNLDLRVRKEVIANIADQLSEIINKSEYKVERSTYAVDVMSIAVGKDVATRQAIKWLCNAGFDSSPNHVLAFGDNERDLAIAEEAARWEGFEVYYFNVGEHYKAKAEGFNFFQTKSRYNLGTAQVLGAIRL